MIQNNKSKKNLLDTSAIIALLKKEPGYKIVENIIASSAMSAINLAELTIVLQRLEISEDEIKEITTDIVPQIIPFCFDLAKRISILSKFTNGYGLSLGDKVCIVTGEYYNMNIYTADKIWSELEIPNAKIHLIR